MKYDSVSAFTKEHIDLMRPVKWNTVKFRDNWTKETMTTTIAVCMEAWNNKCKFATEVHMKNGCRADIVVPDWSIPVIEIMDSENEVSIAAKRVKYESQGVWLLALPAQPAEAVTILRREQGI